MSCSGKDKFRYFYTGNQVGCLNETGLFNFVSGGPAGSGLSAGTLVKKLFKDGFERALWLSADASLTQELLNAAFPFIELQWIAEIKLTSDTTFKVSNKNIYVTDEDGAPRFYEARVERAPTVKITNGEWLNPNFEIGDLSISLNNRDGFFNKYLPQGEEYTQWIGTEVSIYIGFGEERSNYFEVFKGFVPDRKSIETDLETLTLSVYSLFDNDQKPIPTLIYDRVNTPDVNSEDLGKPLPIVYGDWTEEVNQYGDVSGICINAEEDRPDFSIWNISENALMEIGDVYLHRGKRNENDQNPIKLIDNEIFKEPSKGRILIPLGENVLEEPYPLLEGASPSGDTGSKATLKVQDLSYKSKKVGLIENNISIQYLDGTGVGVDRPGKEIVTTAVVGTEKIIIVEISTTNNPNPNDVLWESNASSIRNAILSDGTASTWVDIELSEVGDEVQDVEPKTFLTGGTNATVAPGVITAESASQDFLALGIQEGDIVIKEGAVAPFPTVVSVTAAQIEVSDGVFSEDDKYSVVTNKYAFRKGDKISIKCKGKDLSVMGITRISDTGVLNIDPNLLSVGLRNDYWITDNIAKKVYNFSFDGEVIKEYNYSDISNEITNVSGMAIQTDNTLWLFDKSISKIYRFSVEDDSLGLSFSTLTVGGLNQLLPNGGPLTIDDGNIITLHDQDSGNFYRIDPFAAVAGLIGTYNRSDFAPLALDIVDIASDVNLDHTIVLDRETGKVYRVDKENGALISDSIIDLNTEVSSNFTQPRGVGYYIDGTIFLMNKQDLSIYNYNEFDGVSDNPGFIARDILQAYVGKTTFDFDLRWNETARLSLGEYKARVVINQETETLTFINKFLQAFNTNLYLNFQKYSIFHLSFDNFASDGLKINEGDIKLGSFKPKKEFNQYFNTANADYKVRPFTGDKILSDNYVSPSGVQLATKEVKKTLDLFPLYRRDDLDQILPLFVRLAAAEPEFVELTVGFRFLFAQLNSFYNINFKDIFKKDGEASGRRFDNIPSFVRNLSINLNDMSIGMKLWSLGTTQFGDFTPIGDVGGGQDDQIVLTNLGTVGYVAPVGTITASTINSVTLEDVDFVDAENRQELSVGRAWDTSYKVGLYDGATHELVEELEIQTVSGQIITFNSDISATVLNSVKNSAGFFNGGHYLKYLNFNSLKQVQTSLYGNFTKPIDGYPTTATQELEEQRGGSHSFDDGRVPYVLHPKDFTPS